MENWENLTIGQRIFAIRGKEPRHSFAKSLEIGTATLQRYENGDRQPDLEFLSKLQELTGYSLEYLVYGKERVVAVGNGYQFNLSNEEQLIVEKYRTANEQVRKQILLMLLADNSEIATNTSNHGYINHGTHKGEVKFGK